MEKILDQEKIRKGFEKLKGKIAIIVFKENVSFSNDAPLVGKVEQVDKDKVRIDTKGFVSFGGGGGIGQIEVISFDQVEEVDHFD